MLKRCLWKIGLILAFLGLLGYGLLRSPGYIMIVYAKKQIIMKLWVAVCVALLCLLIIYFLWKGLACCLGLRRRWRGWRVDRTTQQTRQKALSAWGCLLRSEYKPAYALLQKVVKRDPEAFWHHLALVMAASHCQDPHVTLAHIDDLMVKEPSLIFSLMLLQATLAILHGMPQKALSILKEANLLHPNHPRLSSLFIEAYQALDDRQACLQYLRTCNVQRLSNYAPPQLAFIYTVYRDAVEAQTTLPALKKLWKSMPEACQSDALVGEQYAKKLDALGERVRACQFLKEALHVHWHDPLGTLYAQLLHDDAKRVLRDMQKWLRKYPNRPGIMLVLAGVCLKQNMLAKADHYLKEARGLLQTPTQYATMARLLLDRNQQALALICYQEGLLTAMDGA